MPEDCREQPPLPFYLDLGNEVFKYQDTGQPIWEDFGEQNFERVKKIAIGMREPEKVFEKCPLQVIKELVCGLCHQFACQRHFSAPV